MTDQQPVLRKVFAQDEKDTPDAAAVYAQVERLAKGYRLRRWGLQAAGGAVLGAGLIAGSLQLPQFLHEDGVSSGGSAGLVQPAASPDDTQAALDAWDKAGYHDLDTLKLGAHLKDPASVREAKIKVGRKLLAGEKVDPPTPIFTPPADWQAFFDAGYTTTDAEQLRKLWKLADIGEAKAKAGRKLEAGEDLPITKHIPAQEYPMPDRLQPDEQAALDEYRAAGYDEADAKHLAKIWKMDITTGGTAYREAKLLGVEIAAGRELAAGRKLPVKP